MPFVILFIGACRSRGVNFKDAFGALNGHDPYPWQERLYRLFVGGAIPGELDIPTGLGKTSVISIWLIALASSLAGSSGPRVPRRLVYIVDRRVIVDQATEDARRIAEKASGNAAGLHGMGPVHVSTFRGGGGTTDDRGWLKHPDAPAVIIGTVDMIGSRLLFSGYGQGRHVRPFFAGLLGQDSLIVLDEAHLSPALRRTLRNVEGMSGGGVDPPKAPDKAQIPPPGTSGMPRGPACPQFPPKVMLMSATSRQDTSSRLAFGLSDDDLGHSRVRQRYEAKKSLSLFDAQDGDLVPAIVDRALTMSGRTLVYVQAPSAAAKVAARLNDAEKRATVLTGTMRGFERDRLVQRPPPTPNGAPGDASRDPTDEEGGGDLEGPSKGNAIFNMFAPGGAKPRRAECYLVATSAGEVGVDLDADNMVCDLTTFDSLVQRLGRVNRSGGRESRVEVVYSKAAIRRNRALSGRLEKTLALLEGLTKGGEYDASPRSLSAITPEQKEGSLAPEPCTQPLTPDIVDMWSMTSLYDEYAARPAVHHWLRGHEERHVPDTYMAWRDDVDDLARADPASIGGVLDAYPILPHETARSTTGSALKILEGLAQKKRGNRNAIIRKPDSSVVVRKIKDIREDDLRYSTLLLPCSAGGLDEQGMPTSATATVRDVADDQRYKTRRRISVNVWADGRITLAGGGDGGDEEELDDWLDKNGKMRLVYAVTAGTDEMDPQKPAVEHRYYAARPDTQHHGSGAPQSVKDHNKAVEEAAKGIVDSLGLDGGVADAVVAAAARHDLGKMDRHWQECMHGDPSDPLAKIASKKRPRPLGGFRHEFESMARSYDDLAGHPERDLVLHLIAAHHGRARPCFRPNASRGAAHEEHLGVMARYASLQARFGPWGLAWLEGLVRGADWQASEMQEGGSD